MGLAKKELMRQEEEEEEGWYSIPETYVCAHCFHDYAIKEFIDENSVDNSCSYCGQTCDKPIAAEMDEVLSFISHGLHREYEDPVHHVAYDSSEGGYLLPLTDTYDLFCELGFGEGPSKLFDDLVGAFSGCTWVQIDPYSNLQCDEWCYTWDSFSKQVKYKNRFLFLRIRTSSEPDLEPEPFTILDSIGEIVNGLELISNIQIGYKIWRARQHSQSVNPKTAKDIGSPACEQAGQNRFSPAGISMFYGAEDIETCFLETVNDDKSEELVTFGEFEVKKELYLLDLRNLPDFPSLFDENNFHMRMPLRFMYYFKVETSRKISSDGMEHIEYIPTQIVVEYFRCIFETVQKRKIDGILYNSVINNGKSCITLFGGPEICKDDDTSLLLSLTSIKHGRIDFSNNTYIEDVK
ncbi:MAG: RES family NAD+ phosphorylase [Colwellia sp.]|nr:RES family NAD+ phosphorylase [Colwellia sp.]